MVKGAIAEVLVVDLTTSAGVTLNKCNTVTNNKA